MIFSYTKFFYLYILCLDILVFANVFLMNRPTGPFQSLSHNVCELCVCVCASIWVPLRKLCLPVNFWSKSVLLEFDYIFMFWQIWFFCVLKIFILLFSASQPTVHNGEVRRGSVCVSLWQPSSPTSTGSPWYLVTAWLLRLTRWSWWQCVQKALRKQPNHYPQIYMSGRGDQHPVWGPERIEEGP